MKSKENVFQNNFQTNNGKLINATDSDPSCLSKQFVADFFNARIFIDQGRKKETMNTKLYQK